MEPVDLSVKAPAVVLQVPHFSPQLSSAKELQLQVHVPRVSSPEPPLSPPSPPPDTLSSCLESLRTGTTTLLSLTRIGDASL
ncbi:hypothetical protein FOCC_FOCC014563 [Frankliniella occidentalis]|nr:hypothetical protein FOCC_FOCC014563 [Frankliniella occidentalis]